MHIWTKRLPKTEGDISHMPTSRRCELKKYAHQFVMNGNKISYISFYGTIIMSIYINTGKCMFYQTNDIDGLEHCLKLIQEESE